MRPLPYMQLPHVLPSVHPSLILFFSYPSCGPAPLDFELWLAIGTFVSAHELSCFLAARFPAFLPGIAAAINLPSLVDCNTLRMQHAAYVVPRYLL